MGLVSTLVLFFSNDLIGSSYVHQETRKGGVGAGYGEVGLGVEVLASAAVVVVLVCCDKSKGRVVL